MHESTPMPCAPVQDLVKAAGAGSELDLIGAGHMQFARLGGIELLVADDLCGYNSSVSFNQARVATLPHCVIFPQ